jgi:SnoaL-like domain
VPTDIADIRTRLAVEDAVVRMFVATDERDWPTLEDCFSNPFTLDMTSMVGGVPAVLTPQQVASAWSEGFKPLDAVHHQIGNMRTTLKGDSALVRCHGVALHHRSAAQGLKSRVFVGTYEVQLSEDGGSWRITRLVFNLKFIDGNLKLEESDR